MVPRDIAMVKEYLTLRNKLYTGNFRFDLPVNLWKTHYLPHPKIEENNLVRIDRNGVLEGYAVYELMAEKDIRAYRILEICGTSKEVQAQLIDQIISQGVKNGIDFIFIRKNEEPSDVVFDEKKFVSFVDCVIMSALLNPHELLRSISDNVDNGKLLELNIQCFDPVFLRVGHKEIEIVEPEKPDVVVRIDDKTFLKLFFGGSSFLKEFIKGNIRINDIFKVSIVRHFVNAIRQQRIYIPMGDWT